MTHKDVQNIDLSKINERVLEHILNKLVDFKDTFKYLHGTGAVELYSLLLSYEDKVRNELELKPYRK